jgi:hypothetical protein
VNLDFCGILGKDVFVISIRLMDTGLKKCVNMKTFCLILSVIFT